jgi:MFS family permease
VSLRNRLLSPTRRLIGAAFVMDFGAAMTGLGLQNLGVYVLDAPNSVLGLLPAMSSLAYMLSCMVSGLVSDRFGRRRCAVAGCLGMALTWALTPNVGPWRNVLWVVPFSGVALSLFWPSILAWMAEYTTGGRKELTRNIGLFNIMWCSGFMVGPVVTGYLWPVSHALAFYVPAAVVLGLVAVIVTLPRAETASSDVGQAAEDGSENTGLFLAMARIGGFAIWFATSAVSALFPKIGEMLSLPTEVVGWLLFVFRAGQVAVFVYARYCQRWQYRLWPLLLVQTGAMAASLAVAWTSDVRVFGAAFVMLGVNAGLAYVSALFYALHGRQEGKGRSSGFHEAVVGSGIFLGPLVSGLVAEHVNVRAPFVVCAGVLLLATAVQVVLASRGRRRRPAMPAPAGAQSRGLPAG